MAKKTHMALKVATFVALGCVLAAAPAFAQVDLGFDDCDCVGEDCRYAVYCPQYTQNLANSIAEEVVAEQRAAAPAASPPPPPPAPAAAPAPSAPVQPTRQGFLARLGSRLGRFATRFYESPAAAQLEVEVEEEAQLGPRIYMSDEEMIVCKSYEPAAGISEYTPTQSSISVPDMMDLVSMTVDMNVTHARVGALKIELEAKSGKQKPKKAILKPRGWGGSGQNMLSSTFDDQSDVNFPKAKGAPFSGSYRPKGKLKRFVRGKGYLASRGGTKGLWTLRVTDVGRNPDTRSAVINNWRINLCGKVDLTRERKPALSQDIWDEVERVEATEQPMPTSLACPGATLTEDGQCPLSAIDVVQSLLDGTYNSTIGTPGYQQEMMAGDEIASAQGILVPEIEGLPRGPWRQAYDDYVERFNTWADTLPKLSEYLQSLPETTWELAIGYVYFNWLCNAYQCAQAGTCGGAPQTNIPETLVIG
mmetsp:Transcript_10668/g.20114  ORF Transcript_10668/g.20114 Transcript_10668/m.20114 type:complete len:476 (+) Transcript_10668:209-1636(+)|eukprot:CAMPEP_0182612708 /NCGR_PEP_ID=MMETSP1330-20130603/20609_1 /TAXON_ID=464278 /ORGANISM="Picochlorum sp., Strain RCC944" /LENGTH=475 /DNA_ID=CAMNT_0024832299 /DNA_START=136 /DNA_END=1563 /DNA_ORIENTATION=-